MVQRCSNGVAFVVLEPEPSVRTGIRVEIYDGANPFNLLGILPDTFGRKWTEPLRGSGSGGFKVYPTNPALVANPGLLTYGNIARFVVDGVDRFAITIEGKGRTEVSDGEDVDQAIEVTGRGVLAKLEDAQVYPAGGLSGDPERPFTGTNAGAAILALIDEAQARGALVGVTVDFTAAVDSNNAPFAVPLDLTERAGTDLLRVAERHGSAWVDVRMAPGLVLQYFNTRGIDRSLQLVDAGPVQFLPGKNVVELDRDEDGGIRNALLIETPAGFLERVEGASITAHRRREAFLSLGNITDTDAVDRAADAVFQRSAQPAPQMGFEVLDVDGVRPWVDWNVGDWIQAPDEDGELTRYRVEAITVDETEAGRVRYIPELASITAELETRLERWLSAMAKGTVGGTAGSVAEPVKAPAEVVDAIAEGVADHVDDHPHPDELSDLADVDLAGLGDGDGLRYDAAGPAWVPVPRTLHDFLEDVDADPVAEGDMLYQDDGGLWVPVTGSKGTGKVPTIAASGAVQWATPAGGGGGGGGAGKYQLYTPSGTAGDDFADDSIDAAWVPVNNGLAGGSWSELYNTIRFHKSAGVGWGTRDLSVLMRPLTVNVGDYIETAFSYRMRAAWWGACLVMANGDTWGAGTQMITWSHQPAGETSPYYSLEMASYTNFSTMGTRHGGTLHNPIPGEPIYWRLERSGASEFKWYYSQYGDDWQLMDTATLALSPTHVGFGVVNFDNPAAPQWAQFHYFESSA